MNNFMTLKQAIAIDGTRYCGLLAMCFIAVHSVRCCGQESDKEGSRTETQLAAPSSEASDTKAEGQTDPKRNELVRALKTHHEEAISLREQSRFTELKVITAQIQQLNVDLKRMDQLPEVSSLRAEAFRARQSGDHDIADQLDEEAKALHEQLDKGANPEQQMVKSSVAVSPQDRETLEVRLAELRAEVEQNEDTCIKLATAFRDAGKDAKDNAGQFDRLSAELQTAVRTAFETRWQLQEVRLKLTQLDLASLQQKHQRRKILADSIIERRHEQLKHGDELSWIQAATAEAAEREETQLADEPSQKGGGYFATPIAAATEIAARLTAHDFQGFVNLLPDAVVMKNAGRLAGMAQIYDVCGQAGMPF